MKKGLYILIAIFFIAITACRKITESATVIHDCTGQYLRFDNKDYPICNTEIVSKISNGTVVKATFKKVGNERCDDRDNPHCDMLHDYTIGDWIIVTKIK